MLILQTAIIEQCSTENDLYAHSMMKIPSLPGSSHSLHPCYYYFKSAHNYKNMLALGNIWVIPVDQSWCSYSMNDWKHIIDLKHILCM